MGNNDRGSIGSGSGPEKTGLAVRGCLHPAHRDQILSGLLSHDQRNSPMAGYERRRSTPGDGRTSPTPGCWSEIVTLFVPELNVLAPTTQPILYRDQYQRRVARDFPAYANSSRSGRSGYLGLERVGPTGHKYRRARRCSDANRPISYRAIRRAVEIRCLAKPTALSVGISKPA